MTLYFAYGSNMDKKQMAYRCPDAEPLEAFAIKGWRLVFDRYADMERTDNPEDQIRGAIYRITDDCEKSLDRYEGYKPDGSGSYDKMHFQTKRFGDEPVLVYTKNSDTYAKPDYWYLRRIQIGYSDWGFDPNLVLEIAKQFGYNPSNPTGMKPPESKKESKKNNETSGGRFKSLDEYLDWRYKR